MLVNVEQWVLKRQKNWAIKGEMELTELQSIWLTEMRI